MLDSNRRRLRNVRATLVLAMLILPGVFPRSSGRSGCVPHLDGTVCPPDLLVPPNRATTMIDWLPPTVRAEASRHLVDGRLAQAAVGTDLVTAENAWAPWPSLGR
jgi:hypothetical protein